MSEVNGNPFVGKEGGALTRTLRVLYSSNAFW